MTSETVFSIPEANAVGLTPYTFFRLIELRVQRYFTMVASELKIGLHRGSFHNRSFHNREESARGTFRSTRISPRHAAVKVLVVDDHPIVCAGVVDLLRSHDWLVVVGQAADGEEALAKSKALLPDVMLVDINLPKLNGLALIKSLRAQLPDIKLIVLSMHEPELLAHQIVQSGVRGFVCKKVASAELVTALETVAAGGTFFDNHFSQVVLKAFTRDPANQQFWMSPREREVLVGIAEGLSNKEVAARLNIGVRTVDTHRERLVRKLNIRSTARLTRFALQQGLVPQ
jgi:two-component system nitrate/nitrite response regulator NarL